MTILYSNGCSYTANLDLARDERYPIILSKKLGWDCKDRAEPGSCNSRIIRTTIEDCIKLRKQSNEKIFAMIQLSHLFRTEYPDDTNPLGDPFYSIKPNILSNVPEDVVKYSTLYWKLYNERQLLINLLTLLIGLTGYFNHNNINYLIYLGPNENVMYTSNLKNDVRFAYLKKDSGLLDLEKFYMLDLLDKKDSHPDQIGMQKISDYFYEKISLLCEPA